MAHGPRICASCGSLIGVEEHHIVPRVHGGMDMPTVYLCFECHGAVHSFKRNPKHSELIRLGIQAAKERGVVFGTKAKRNLRLQYNEDKVILEIKKGIELGVWKPIHFAKRMMIRGLRNKNGHASWTSKEIQEIIDRRKIVVVDMTKGMCDYLKG